ncbi:MAG: hypothetical protein V4717_08410 [Bacteroidota bacterium]
MKKIFLFLLFCNTVLLLAAQPVTGVWRGKLTSGSGMFASAVKVELKLIAKGDSLFGTSYYYSNTNSYIRYSVKGYFDKEDNAVHWWDDQFLGVKPAGKITVSIYNNAMRSDADFNCPGGNVMKLDGNSKIGDDGPEFVLHFDKTEKPLFKDEWDNVIEGYFTGMADPQIIDSVYAITPAYHPEIPSEVIAKINPPKNIKKDSGKEEVINKKPGESITGNPPTDNAKMPEPISVKPSDVALAKVDTAVDRDAKKSFGTGAESSEKDSQFIAKQQSIKEDSINNELKAKASTSAPATSAENPLVVNKKPVTSQGDAGAGQTNKQVVNNTPVPAKPIVVPPVVATKTTEPTINKPTNTNPETVAKSNPVVIKPFVTPERTDPVAVQKFITRKKINQGEILIEGDTIELNFYDNAEVDGDSISLFLNGKLLFNHVLLSAQAYTFKLGVKDLPAGSELTMVAENLGSIPPNTAYMMVIVDGQRYTARLESTEQSSGVIKLVRRQ